jgi:uncharacterized damage-inducible protein DinB
MFQKQSVDYLKSEYLTKIELAIAPLTIEQIWWRPNEASNSIGNLMLHLAGNVREWIVGGVGGQTISRDRDREFSTRGSLSAAELTARLRSVVEEACDVIGQVSDPMLQEFRSIQRFDTTVFGAIYHVVEHFAMHTGQIILLAKAQTGRDAGFYKVRADGTPEPVFSTRRAFTNEPEI